MRNIGTRPWQILPHLPVPEPEIDEDDVPIQVWTGDDFYVERLHVGYENWNALPPAIQRIGAAVALDMSLDNLDKPYYKNREGSEILLGVTRACQDFKPLVQTFVDWILDNPSKASLPIELSRRLTLNECTRSWRNTALRFRYQINKPFDATQQVTHDLLLSYTLKSVAWLRTATFEGINALGCSTLGEQFDYPNAQWLGTGRYLWQGQTQTDAVDYAYCLTEALQLWWQEVQNVLAFDIPESRRPFV